MSIQLRENTGEKATVISLQKVACGLLIIGLLLPSLGFCDASSTKEMNEMATSVVDTIFAPWVRKTALALGGGLGLIHSMGGGGWKPLVGWGGLGIFINYLPKVINFLTTLGS